MQSIFQFVPLVVVLCLYAAFVRLAARITKASGVGWLRAFQFAALVVLLSVLGRVVTLYVGQDHCSWPDSLASLSIWHSVDGSLGTVHWLLTDGSSDGVAVPS
jgi:hypothetical protein